MNKETNSREQVLTIYALQDDEVPREDPNLSAFGPLTIAIQIVKE